MTFRSLAELSELCYYICTLCGLNTVALATYTEHFEQISGTGFTQAYLFKAMQEMPSAVASNIRQNFRIRHSRIGLLLGSFRLRKSRSVIGGTLTHY